MDSFTTQITNASIIAELPDVSILTMLYDDNLTQKQLLSQIDSVSFRKKFQSLLEFKLSDTSKAILYDTLKKGYINFETKNGHKVTETNGNVFVDGRLVAFTVDGFADGIFEDETFAALFFTQDTIDAIFKSKDESFIKALVSVSNFWDKLLSNSDLASHIETTYPQLISSFTKTIEVAYVKIVSYKAGLDFKKYKDIKYLAEDSPAMDTIFATPEAKAIEQNSRFGVTARLMYIFDDTDINSIANSDDNINRIKNDNALKNTIVNLDTVLILPSGSKMRKFVIDNDEYFGTIAAQRLNIETTVSLSNIFYDETFSAKKIAFVEDSDLIKLLFESTLYPNFQQQFYEAFTSLNVSSQKFAFKVNEVSNTLTAHYTNSAFKVKKLTLSLDDFTETKKGSVSDVKTDKRIFFTPYTFIDGSEMGVAIDHTVQFNNSDNYNLYNEFLDDKFATIIGSSGHILGITTSGRVVSSKFAVDLNLSDETIQNITVTQNNAFIKTDKALHAIGNFGANRDDIIKTLTANKDNLSKAVYFNGQVLALGTDNAIKVVDASGVSAFSAASDIKADDIMVIAGRFVVLAQDGSLSEIKSDNTIVSIAKKVANIVYSQDAIVCTVDGADRAIFSKAGTWFVYDFNVNTL